MDRYFPIIKIRGNAEDRGRQHGTLLKERIHRTIKFNQSQFQLPEEEVLEFADQFRKATLAFREELYVEIEALARAAAVDPLWIYALNGRTELLNLNPMECTTLAFKNQGLIGQNWDWESDMEELAVILDIEKEDGHRIMTMTEPGMIGKIGMNHCGVGVCLNFMTIENYQPCGIPLHVILRTILDSKSLDEAQSQLKILGMDKIKINYEEKANILPKTVLKQSIKPGTSVDEEKEIELTVSEIEKSEE